MIDLILTSLNSETTLSILQICIGGLGGVILNNLYLYYRNKIQKMQCFYLEDDILSKIPSRNDDNTIHENIHCKRYKVINTTNKDITEFKLFFQFDATADILECYSQSKEGYNRQRIRKNTSNKNEAEAIVKNFNRGDELEYVFKVANISANDYYITESSCIGFKVKCKDKRKTTNKSKSRRSSQILIVKKG